jgi:hypothetical protein
MSTLVAPGVLMAVSSCASGATRSNLSGSSFIPGEEMVLLFDALVGVVQREEAVAA